MYNSSRFLDQPPDAHVHLETSLRHDAEKLENAIETRQGDVIAELTSLSAQRVLRLLSFARTVHKLHVCTINDEELRILLNNINKSEKQTAPSCWYETHVFVHVCLKLLALDRLLTTAKTMSSGTYNDATLQMWRKNQSQVSEMGVWLL